MYLMYQDGLSLQKIGFLIGVTRQSVYDRFVRKNLKMRTRINKPFIIRYGYKFTINKNGYYECTTIDRLMLHNIVWEKHNGKKIPKGYEIHHKDFNKLNNNIDNLQLITPSEHTKLHVDTHWMGSGMNKKVVCVETGVVYNSIVQLSKIVGKSPSNVSSYYIDGKRKINGLTYEKI